MQALLGLSCCSFDRVLLHHGCGFGVALVCPQASLLAQITGREPRRHRSRVKIAPDHATTTLVI